ncbi:MAG: Cysteine desulfurase [Candidatus Magasanikbacteria bacterium GW2011_GWA2_45_39]|uniref:cysteine desulfurase n=1 Tax=Candidatus Magasanikbacteria bacterium GW2011_GWA2_45_39 TaxID=1619041 RepID=A0A0G1MHG7_9BACT|nr:MAG: Cysteine desulfurase [Candidatus Magasanikbacteria bacterium GW2011_GWA2_45_39]
MTSHRNIDTIRAEFPLLATNPELAYLDNAAGTQKPEAVLKAMDAFYRTSYANVHRSVYDLSERATAQYEDARGRVAHFLNAQPQEIIFTKNATEAINLVAYSFGEENVHEGDEVLVSILEHHANFLPWQRLCAQKKARLVVAPVRADGTLDEEQMLALISARTKIVALTALSNVTGTRTPLARIIERVHQQGARVIIDGAQAVAHEHVDIRAMGADFFVFSGHKVFGPTGIGVLAARAELLETMQPFIVGGEMVKTVSLDNTEWNDIPWKFEAGTPPIAEAIGLKTAIDFIESIGWPHLHAHEQTLVEYALERVRALKGVHLIGPETYSSDRAPIISFTVDGVHPHDLASILNERHVAIRSGHFCAQPFLNALSYTAAARASFTIYNTHAEVDALIEGIAAAQKIFRV